MAAWERTWGFLSPGWPSSTSSTTNPATQSAIQASSIKIVLEMDRNTRSQGPHQLYWIRSCMGTRLPDGQCAHWSLRGTDSGCRRLAPSAMSLEARAPCTSWLLMAVMRRSSRVILHRNVKPEWIGHQEILKCTFVKRPSAPSRLGSPHWNSNLQFRELSPGGSILVWSSS